MAIALIVYSIIFWPYVYKKYRNYGLKTWKTLTMSYCSAMIGPCITIDPRSMFLFTSSLISMIGHLIVMTSILVLAYVDPSKLTDPIQVERVKKE